MNQLINRGYECEVRADNKGDEYLLIGRPIVYDKKTDLGYFDEIIEKGALKKTDLTDVRFLVNHDTNKLPLARSRKNTKNSTMRLAVDDEGMEVRVKLDVDDNTEAKNLYSAVKRGDITGMSFMFSIDREEWDDLESEHPLRRILDIGSVIEVSAVTFPAYEATKLSARDNEKALENARSAVETAGTTVETEGELSLLKEKTKLLGGY